MLFTVTVADLTSNRADFSSYTWAYWAATLASLLTVAATTITTNNNNRNQIPQQQLQQQRQQQLEVICNWKEMPQLAKWG